MTITLDAELAARLTAMAEQQGRSPETIALEIIRDSVKPSVPPMPEPRDEWERRLLATAVDHGASFSDEDLGRERIYED